MRFRRQADRPLVVDPCMGDATAVRLQEALRRRDWPATREILVAAEHPDERAFYLAVCGTVPGVDDWITEWVIAEPHSTLPQLVRGCYAVSWAWAARGQLDLDLTRDMQLEVFYERLRLAETCLGEVVGRDPDEVAAWAFLVRSARGLRMSIEDGRHRFEQAVRRHPTSLKAHYELMQTLCRKWFGSDEQMYEFARVTTAEAPAGSLLHYLTPLAHLEVMTELPAKAASEYMGRPAIRFELHAAAERSIWHPDVQFRPGWPEPVNAFALAFSAAGDYEGAARAFDQLDGIVTAQPWAYIGGDTSKAFAAYRQRAYASRR